MKSKVWLLLVFAILIALATSCSRMPGSEKVAPEVRIRNGIYLEGRNVGGMLETDVLREINKLAGGINKDKVEAKLDEVSWELIREEKGGTKVNVQKTLDILKGSKENEKIRLAIEDVKPEITSQALLGNIVKIAGFTTPILDRDNSRVNNIQIAAEKLDYIQVLPGEEFSFNSTLGKRTRTKGYEKAPIIVKTEDGYKKGYGVGGGICQVATTLYNAVERCGLKITERHTHSKDVHYVPRGQDATVSYGSVDFKFVNNRNHPVMIRTYISKGSLSINILENRNI